VDRFEQSKIEARLKKTLGDAKTAYDSAKEKYLRALERREDLGTAHPDGALAYRQALRERDWLLGSTIKHSSDTTGLSLTAN
jgi:hypothetical protein